MCGVVGIFNFEDQSANATLLKRMVSELFHRGPDSSGVWLNNNIGLGHTRLSIIDLSHAANQPMIEKSSGSVISYNGEVYNYLELKKQLLAQESFKSSSDTEVILKCLLKYGISIINKFEGMFAFAFFDAINSNLYLACDHVGIKPLYYHFNKNRIIFASEIKSLFYDEQTPRIPNNIALQQHIMFGYSLAPMTAFKEIKRLEPGHYLKINAEGIHDICYWSAEKIDWEEETSNHNIEPIFDHSMSIHIRSDVPWGGFLSGGLDSTLMMSSLARRESINQNFIAFNVGKDHSSDGYDKNLTYERQGAISTASYYNFKLEKINLPKPSEINFDSIINSLEEPICNPAAILIDIICQRAKEHSIPVLLSGHGGDEIFAGYRRHILARYFDQIKMFRYFLQLTQYINCSPEWKRISACLKVDTQNGLAITSAIGWDFINEWNVAPDLLPPKQVWNVLPEFTKILNGFSHLSPLKQMLILDYSSYLSSQNLIVLDKMSMKHSIESRVPFLHLPLIINGWKRNDNELLKRGKGKVLLRKMAQSRLPSSILKRPKAGFDFPINEWLNSEAAKDLLFSSKSRQRGIFDQSALKKYYNSCNKRNINNIRLFPLYNAAIIEQWHRTMI